MSTTKTQGLVTSDDRDGIAILRAYTIPPFRGTLLSRLLSFMSFMGTSLVAALRARQVDLVIGTSPPMFQAFSAWLVAFLRRRPFLMEVRDLWPDFLVDMGKLRNPVAIALFRAFERFLYARATHIVVNSPAYADHLKQGGIPPEKISVVSNGVDPAMFHPEWSGERLRANLGVDGKYLVTYAGALGLANDIEVILRAAQRLRSRDDIHILLVGDGPERRKLERQAQDMGLCNIIFAGAHSKNEMPEFLAASNACMATLQNVKMFRMVYPNKVFDYMAAGRPTVLAIDGVIRDVIEAAKGGIFVQPGDDAALADAITALADDPERGRAMGSAAREYVVRHFNRSEQAEQFAMLVKFVAQHS